MWYVYFLVHLQTSSSNVSQVWERDTERLIITYRAHRDIPAGEELCGSRNMHLSIEPAHAYTGISYGSHLTFKDTDNVDAETAQTEQDGLDQLNQIQLD